MTTEYYGRYVITAKFRGDHWIGYTTCPDDDIAEIIERKIHGGITCETSVFVMGQCPSQDKYQRQIGFETALPGDCNISPEGTVHGSFEDDVKTWDKEAVIKHLKEVIDTAEILHKDIARARY